MDEATSARAALKLKTLGVGGVRALLGGWNQWVNDGNRTVPGDAPGK